MKHFSKFILSLLLFLCSHSIYASGCHKMFMSNNVEDTSFNIYLLLIEDICYNQYNTKINSYHAIDIVSEIVSQDEKINSIIIKNLHEQCLVECNGEDSQCASDFLMNNTKDIAERLIEMRIITQDICTKKKLK